MLGKFRSRLTYANVVATLALFLALGGGTTAVALQGRNTVDSGDIINQQVRSADLQDEGVASRDIQNFTVTGDDVSPNNTLKGQHIEEATLSSVPFAHRASDASFATDADQARRADSVDGQSVETLSYRRLVGSSGVLGPAEVPAQFLALGSLRLEASCSTSGNLEIFAKTTAESSYIRSSTGQADESFNPGEQLEVQGPGDGTLQLSYRHAIGNGITIGDTVTVLLSYDESSSVCQFAGTAVGA